MPIPRLIATDLDGTLLRSDGTISARTRRALRAAQGQGIPIVMVTARRGSRVVSREKSRQSSVGQSVVRSP